MKDGIENSDLSLVLFILHRFTLMPELLDFFDFDDERFLEFIARFGGMTMVIPTRDEIARTTRDVHVMKTLRNDRSKAAIDRLADFYGLDPKRIVQIEQETKEACRKLDDI